MRVPSVAVMLRSVRELLEELALVYVPASVEPCVSQLWRKSLKLFYVVGLGAHKSGVVGNKRLYKGIVILIFTLLVSSVDENPLYISVSLSARIAGIIYSFWESSDYPQACGNRFHLKFRKLGRLVEKNYIVFDSLKTVKVFIACAVGKAYRAAV